MKKTKVIVGIILMIFIIIAIITGCLFIFKKEIIILGTSGNTSSTSTLINNYLPQIYYIDSENIKQNLKEEQIINSNNIKIIGGEVEKFEKDGKTLKYSEDAILEEGKYTIELKTEGKVIYTRTFYIDRTPPVVTGFKKGASKTDQTIIFDDITDIAKAILKKQKGKTDANTVDLLELYKQEKLQKNNDGKYIYTIKESGNYVFTVADKAGNTLVYTINIRK